MKGSKNIDKEITNNNLGLSSYRHYCKTNCNEKDKFPIPKPKNKKTTNWQSSIIKNI